MDDLEEFDLDTGPSFAAKLRNVEPGDADDNDIDHDHEMDLDTGPRFAAKLRGSLGSASKPKGSTLSSRPKSLTKRVRSPVHRRKFINYI